MMELPSYETLELEFDRGVATVWLNRGDKANSMNAAMWRELQASFEWCDATAQVRVVMLAARGKHFCAGLDLAMFGDTSLMPDSSDPARAAEAFRRSVLALQNNLSTIERCRKPVLACIHYTCIGGGIDMVTCADMRYCTEDAYFAIKEIDIGMVADVGTLQRLPKLIGDGMVRELAYTGRRFDAAEALSLGLVNRVYADHSAMLEGVTQIAREIAGKSPLAIRGSKEMLLYSRDHNVADGLNYIATWNAAMLSAGDLHSAIAAGTTGDTVEFDD
ncbi:MAG: enoyl-CoA hydratase [Halieaceae bacterium]|jgi:enoyl-CoA hydratase